MLHVFLTNHDYSESEAIDARAVIPMYILDAIVFAAKDILSEKLLWKMVQYSFEQYNLDSDFDDLKVAFKEAKRLNFFMFFALGQKRTCIYLVNVGELQRVVRNILQQMSYP